MVTYRLACMLIGHDPSVRQKPIISMYESMLPISISCKVLFGQFPKQRIFSSGQAKLKLQPHCPAALESTKDIPINYVSVLWNYGGADTRNFLRKLLSAYDIVPVCCGQYLYLNESSIMIFATKQQRKARYQHQMVSYKQLLYVSNGLQSYPKRGCSSL